MPPAADDGDGPDTPFAPHPLLRGPHAQTLWANLPRPFPWPAVVRQRLELDDGDFLDLDWTRGGFADGAPLVLVLHGLEGSSRATYVRDLVHHLTRRGLQSVAMNFRGCSGTPNRIARSYHSGETADLDTVARGLRRRFPGRRLYVVGYSLGGNVVLKWLGEQGDAAPVDAAVAISVPLLLAECAWRMERGASRFYLWHLLRRLRRTVRRKFTGMAAPIDVSRALAARGFREFDDCMTAPLNGFRDADDYYGRSSSRQYLPRIRRPTLVLHARDDPFMTEAVLPQPQELPSWVRLEASDRGGHVGFVEAHGAMRLPRLWLPRRIAAWLDSPQAA